MIYRVAAAAVLLSYRFISLAAAQQQHNITYNVVAMVPSANMTIAVTVDNATYPLSMSKQYQMLYTGEAPIAKDGYHYSILTDQEHNVLHASESFSRRPSNKDTVNEFFNRSTSIYPQRIELPQIYSPLSVVDRVKSDLHVLEQIPVIHIWGNQSDIDYLHENQLEDLDVQLGVTFYGSKDIFTFKDVKVSLAGRSSRYIPKLSYGLKMKTKGNDSLYGYKKLKLRALGMDPSYLRECIAYHTLEAAGVPASGFSYVRVFINQKPAGLYGLIETFQDPWLSNIFGGGDEKYKSGFLYQGQIMAMNQTLPLFSDLSYYGENLTLYNQGQYKIKAGPQKDEDKESPEDYEELKDFTKFIDQSSENTTVDEWEKHIDTEGFIRAMAVEDLLGFSDAYMTMADNYYVYSDPKHSGRMVYIPADLDTTLGIALFEMDYMLSGNYSRHPGFSKRPLTSKMFSQPELLDRYKRVQLKLSQSLIHPSIMNPYIDSLVKLIYDDVQWDKTLPGMGQYTAPPLDDMGAIAEGNGSVYFFPEGFRTNWTDVPQTFESAINGPTNSTTLENVRGFIEKKSRNVISFLSNNNGSLADSTTKEDSILP